MGLLGIVTGEVTVPEEPYDTRPTREDLSAKSKAIADGATSEENKYVSMLKLL